MKFQWRPHWIEGHSIAKQNGCSIIRCQLSQVEQNHSSLIGGAMYEVMDKEGEIHRFNSRREMETFVGEQ